MAMKLTALVPMVWTDDIPSTIAYYRDKLGFNCPVEIDGWACLERDGIELMLSRPNEHEPYHGPNFSGSFYFRCDDVDAWWEELKDRATVVYPIENFEYGMREFAIRDNNGYILQFGKELE
jgi:uncharacterized glyoxalase superfamily protein PhnB